MITFALAKGRLASLTLEKLNAIGIHSDDASVNSRKLVFLNHEQNIKFFLAKASDVPTYVEHGVADIGVVGKDTLLEEKRSLYELLDLGFGQCRIVVAGKKGLDLDKSLSSISNFKVATKYPNIAKDYFFKTKNKSVEIIKLNGSVELGAIIGLADVIVDIVETGTTLKENGLDILDSICDISARLVVNKVSMKLKHQSIADIIQNLKNL